MEGNRKQLGALAEKLAADHLQRKGYKILVRNYRCRYGEIDVIALDGRTLVFVEVRAKGSTGFGTPQESITHQKRLKVREVARHYLTNEVQKGSFCRFDVVAVQFEAGGRKVKELEHIENAF
ncbi:MAG: YraN family protein [Ammonifex sp.]|nr:MAG: YraN family protein [Ammonifex sp.]